jgi:hypothetical protein
VGSPIPETCPWLIIFFPFPLPIEVIRARVVLSDADIDSMEAQT